MKTIEINLECLPDSIPLGQTGDHSAMQVCFEASAFAQLYGQGRAVVLYRRTRKETPYPVAVEQCGSRVTWTVSRVDTAHAGYGEAEFQWYAGETLKKSVLIPTRVARAMEVPAEAPPESHASWGERILAAGAAVLTAAEQAADIEARLPETIEAALRDAKESGMFDGPQGIQGPPGESYDDAELEALKKKLEAAADKLDVLWEVSAGKTMDFYMQMENGRNAPPAGALAMSLEVILGMTTQNESPSPEHPQEIHGTTEIHVRYEDEAGNAEERIILPPEELHFLETAMDGLFVYDGMWYIQTRRLHLSDLKYVAISTSNSTYNVFTYEPLVGARFDDSSYQTRRLGLCCDKFIGYTGTALSAGLCRYVTISDSGWKGNARVQFYVPKNIDSRQSFEAYIGHELELVVPMPTPIERAVDETDLEWLRTLECLSTKGHMTVTDQNGAALLFMMEYVRNLSEVMNRD